MEIKSIIPKISPFLVRRKGIHKREADRLSQLSMLKLPPKRNFHTLLYIDFP